MLQKKNQFLIKLNIEFISNKMQLHDLYSILQKLIKEPPNCPSKFGFLDETQIDLYQSVTFLSLY